MAPPLSEQGLDAVTDAPGLLLIGVDHHCAPLELREKVAYNGDEGEPILQALVEASDIAEAYLLSTCNRTELYILADADDGAYRLGLEKVFLSREPQIESTGRFYVKRGSKAAAHLFEVAGGLHSMVLGEPEILGQVRKAARQAETLEVSGTVLRQLLRAAIAAGGRARQDSGISAGAISFGYAVVDLARNIFERLESSSVLLIGAGETARQVTRNLIERGARELVVTNRSQRRVDEFLELFPNARSVPYGERGGVLGQADVIVASTAAEEPVLRRDDLARAMFERRGRPLLVADLGVPRNVEVAAGKLDNLFLQDIDSLEDLIAQNLKRRREEIPRVQVILDQELRRFLSWYHGLAAEPLVEMLQKRAEKIRRQEVESARQQFPDATHSELDRLTRSLVRKILHHPSAHLRSSGRSDHARLEVVRQLFQLDED